MNELIELMPHLAFMSPLLAIPAGIIAASVIATFMTNRGGR